MTIARLIEAVEAGHDDSEKWRPALGDLAHDGMAAFHGSLDAAKRLHDALLPGWTRYVDATVPEDGVAVTLYAPGSNFYEAAGDLQCEARAWLLAILRAMEGRE